MTTQQIPARRPKNIRLLWVTCDFATCLSTDIDTITPQLFLALMLHPGINQIKRFTQSEELGEDDIATWAPGIFTMQVYRSTVLDVLTQVTSMLIIHLGTNTPDQLSVTFYTQLGGRHYPVTTTLSSDAIKTTAIDIETMVAQYEKTR